MQETQAPQTEAIEQVPVYKDGEFVGYKGVALCEDERPTKIANGITVDWIGNMDVSTEG